MAELRMRFNGILLNCIETFLINAASDWASWQDIYPFKDNLN